MKIYTRTGDRGRTGLVGGSRVSKASGRVEVCGEIDELNSAIGLARAFTHDRARDRLLLKTQQQLMEINAQLARPSEVQPRALARVLSGPTVREMEKSINRLSEDLPRLKNLVIPAGGCETALLHVVRTICRRAERRLVALSEKEAVNPEFLRYFNRLGDLLFVLARSANHQENRSDIYWKPRVKKRRAKKALGRPD
jgi:cob(I)alamin adenosyltransferase